jgi:SAM-dependent methyltransferase
MKLDELAAHWNEFGRTDPLWAVLAVAGTENSGWDVNQFFESGRLEIAHVLHLLEQAGVTVKRRRALDFGCGVGRLTQALGEHFDQACGVDIAPSMIELAQKYNQLRIKCQYYLNRANDLALFHDGSFTFIYSVIVLQHMKPKYSKNYIREMLRVLAPDGVFVFQIPTGDFRYVPPTPVDGLCGTRTRCTKRLSKKAVQARITPQIESISRNPGVQVVIPVKVQNVSPLTWPALGAPNGKYQILLANHWYDHRDKLVTKDDGRATLPRDLIPGDTLDISLPVTTPSTPGRYLLDFELVQEHVMWFRKKGTCQSTKVQVDVHPVEGKQASPASITPRMEMHGIPKADVIRLIRRHGGELIQVTEDPGPGPLLESFTYFVRKQAHADRCAGFPMWSKGLSLLRLLSSPFVKRSGQSCKS